MFLMLFLIPFVIPFLIDLFVVLVSDKCLVFSPDHCEHATNMILIEHATNMTLTSLMPTQLFLISCPPLLMSYFILFLLLFPFRTFRIVVVAAAPVLQCAAAAQSLVVVVVVVVVVPAASVLDIASVSVSVVVVSVSLSVHVFVSLPVSVSELTPLYCLCLLVLFCHPALQRSELVGHLLGYCCPLDPIFFGVTFLFLWQ